MEAFSDGVFAIAITLLVLDIKVPKLSELSGSGGLLAALLKQWPMFAAYLTSFATILVMWVNHHKLFNHIRRSNDTFLFLNGLLLLLVTFVPFPTALVSAYLRDSEARTAAAIYAGTYEAIAIAFNLLWNYASAGRRLLDPRASLEKVRAITRQYRVGPVSYLVAFLLAFVSVPASLGICMLLAVFFSFTGTFGHLVGGRRPEPSP
ncbi:MAG TPA: TMEM175 family protein [Thermoanaerobaculia bacterium]|nr:TMEM175 family protein [Thermoanaerobaculia bacterium]